MIRTMLLMYVDEDCVVCQIGSENFFRKDRSVDAIRCSEHIRQVKSRSVVD